MRQAICWKSQGAVVHLLAAISGDEFRAVDLSGKFARYRDLSECGGQQTPLSRKIASSSAGRKLKYTTNLFCRQSRKAHWRQPKNQLLCHLLRDFKVNSVNLFL